MANKKILLKSTAGDALYPRTSVDNLVDAVGSTVSVSVPVLDANGKLDSSYLPSYVDDIVDLLAITGKPLERMKKMIAAFNAAAEGGPLTSFELVCDGPERDAFRRYSEKSGAEILCVFNRADTPFKIGRDGLLDADTGAAGDTVPPHDCKLFWKKAGAE